MNDNKKKNVYIYIYIYILRMQQIEKSKINFVDNVDESVSKIFNLRGL